MKFLATLVLFSSLFGSFSSYAETPRSNYISTEVQELPNPSLLLGFASYNDTTQSYLFNSPTQKNYEGAQEAYLGWKFGSGWSTYGIVKAFAESYNGQATQSFHWVTGDSSITVGHPLIYKSYSIEVGGQFRAYVPLSSYTVGHAISPFAYYSTLTYKPDGKTEVVNTFVPRYFYEANPIAGDTSTYFEDRTTWKRKTSSSFAYGFGQWTQLENHYQTTSGYCNEVYPFLDYKPTPDITMGPRLYFPLSANGSVYAGPTSAALDNIRAELFFAASL